MIVDPDRYIKTFADFGSGAILTVHYEACTHLAPHLQAIKAEGMKAGVALNPHTTISVLEAHYSILTWCVLMSVNPGFGGQKFIPRYLRKGQATLRRSSLLNQRSYTIIEIDGGVTDLNTAQALAVPQGRTL